MLYDGYFQVVIGLGLIVYSFFGKMYGHFSKSKMKVIQQHGGLFFRIIGTLMIIMGVINFRGCSR